MLGLSFEAFTTIHVALSVMGIAAGFIAMGGLLAGTWLGGWMAVFLGTTLLSVLTGFLFPIPPVTPAQILGVLTLVALVVAGYALYARGLAGGWRAAYLVAFVASLYFNVFVGVVQGFQKFPPLAALAPTQTEAAFVASQLAVLVTFAVLGALVFRRFPPLALQAAGRGGTAFARHAV